MTTTDLITEYGAYYTGSPENAQRLFNNLFAATNTLSHFREMPTTHTRWEAAISMMTRVLQPYQKAFTPLNPLEIKPKVINLDHLKIDILEYPTDLEESWAGFLARLGREKGVQLDPTTYPFIRWFIEDHILPQAAIDKEVNEVYFGVKAAPTPGTAGGAATGMNGIREILDDAVTASEITPVNTGAWDSDDSLFVEQIEDWVATVNGNNPRHAGKAKKLFMRSYLGERYSRGMRKLYGKDTDWNVNGLLKVMDSKVLIVPVESMDADPLDSDTPSDRIWMTMPENMVNPKVLKANMDAIQVSQATNPRGVNLYTDYYEAVGFLYNELVFINDLD